MSTEDNKALMRRWNEAVNQRNWAVFDELCAPDFVYHNASRTIRGLEPFKQFLSLLFIPFPDMTATVDDSIAEGDRVMIRQTFRGTHTRTSFREAKGTLTGIPPTGKQVTLTASRLTRVANGKAVEQWANNDDLGVLQQLGIIPALLGLAFLAGIAGGIGLTFLLRKVLKS